VLDLRAAEVRGLIVKCGERQDRFEASTEKRFDEEINKVIEHITTIGQDEDAMHSIFEWFHQNVQMPPMLGGTEDPSPAFVLRNGARRVTPNSQMKDELKVIKQRRLSRI
jgi:hypothetical protein